MRVALYCRISTKQNQSVERQIFELRECAKYHKWTIVEEYIDEGVSGSTKQRDGLERMLKDAMQRKFDMVATIELSRLGRSVKHMCEIAEILQQKNIHLFIKNQSIDTSTIAGTLFFNIINSIAQYERDLLIERIKSGLESAKRKGKVLGRRTNLTNKVRNQIVHMKSKQIGLKKIAKECKVSVKTIRKVLDETPLIRQVA